MTGNTRRCDDFSDAQITRKGTDVDCPACGDVAVDRDIPTVNGEVPCDISGAVQCDIASRTQAIIGNGQVACRDYLQRDCASGVVGFVGTCTQRHAYSARARINIGAVSH